MHQVVASWYMEGESGLLEAVLSSDSLSDVTTKQQYYDSIRQEISIMMDKISVIKTDLIAQKDEANLKKTDLDNMKAQQIASKNSVEIRKSQKDQILGMTLAQKSQYLTDADKYEKEVSRVTEELRRLRASSARNNGETVVVSGSGGYSVNMNAYGVDPWGFVAFQCTSYAAWYWNQQLGKSWINTRPGSGSAWNWPALASDQGYSVSTTPRVGAIISWNRMAASPTYGHVAIVEAVHGDGRIDISEYNWSVSEGFDRRYNVDPGYYGDYHYIY
jgi:surface antigen